MQRNRKNKDSSEVFDLGTAFFIVFKDINWGVLYEFLHRKKAFLKDLQTKCNEIIVAFTLNYLT